MKDEKTQSVAPISAWEMEIMQVLWQNNGVTISQAQAALGRPIGYTTVQTRLNRLLDKGLAQKSAERPALYRAAVAPETVSAGHLGLLKQRATGGNVVPLIAQLMQDHPFTPDEIAALKKLVQKHESALSARKGGRHD